MLATTNRILATIATLCLVTIGCSGPSSSRSSSASPVATDPARSTSPSIAAASHVAASGAASTAAWLAYQSFDGANHIRVVRADRSDDHLVADGSHPDWSPDGEWIAYQVDDLDVWIVRADGTGARRLFDCEDPCVIGDSAAWSPDGRELAFTTADAVEGRALSARISAVDVSSGKTRTLIETRGPDYPAYPRWSPDGRSIVVAIQRFASTNVSDCTAIGTGIATVDLTATQPKPRLLTDLSMFADYADWSPDGRTIVFNTYDQGRRDFGCAIDPKVASDIYTIGIDGSALTQLSHNATGTTLIRELVPVNDPGGAPRGTASGPLSSQATWAPDGRSIVFTHVDGPSWPGFEIWTMNADGTGARSFASPPIVGSHARFRPATGR